MTDYLTKAEGLKRELAEAWEVVSDALFTAMNRKGRPSYIDRVLTVLNSTSAQQRGEMKQDLANFAARHG